MSDNVVKLKMTPRGAILKRIILFVVLTLAALGVIALYVFRDELNLSGFVRRVRNLGISEAEQSVGFTFDAGNANQYASFGGGLAVGSVTGFASYDKDGEQTALLQVPIGTPQLAVGENNALFFDAGGYSLRMLSKKGNVLLEQETEKPIYDADISEKDWVCCAASEPGYKTVLYLYNPDGALCYRWFSSSQYLPVCSASPDGKRLAAVGLGQKDGEFVSSVSVFSSGSTDSAEQIIPVGNELIYDLHFMSEDVVCAVGENTARFFPINGAMSCYDYSSCRLEDYSMEGSGFLALVLNKYQAGSRYTIASVAADGTLLGEAECDKQILSCKAKGGYVAVLTASELILYDKEMNVFAQTDNTMGASDVVLRENGSAILLGNGQGKLFVP